VEERTRFQNVILIILAAMVVVFGVLTGIVRSQKGVLFNETLLKVEQTVDGTVYAGSIQGVPTRITVAKVSETVTEVTYQAEGGTPDVYAMEYPLEPVQAEGRGTVPGIRILRNGSVLFQGGYAPEEEFLRWFDVNGEWDADITFSGGYDGYARKLELSKSNVAYFAEGPELTSRGSWGLYLLMVLLTGLVALDVLFPKALFYMRHVCDVRDPEPSDFYLSMQKVSWVGYPILLLIGYIYVLRGFY